MDVDVLAGDEARLDTIAWRARPYERERGLDRLLHHFAQLAGGPDQSLAGNRHRLDGEQLAADLGPGQARDGADLVFFLANAVAEFPYARKVADIVRRQQTGRAAGRERWGTY